MANEDVTSMLSTTDNPFDPFDQFDEWLAFDESHGYHTCAYLARIARTADSLSDEEEAIAVGFAIDEILELNLTGRYVKVQKGQFVTGRKLDV